MALTPTFIQQMYVAYFGRPADPGGLAFYASFDENSLVQAFSASPESQALYGTTSPLLAIDAVYQNLFNRGAEPAGLAAWNALLSTGQITLANMALSILRGAANDDLIAVSNKVTAAALFTSHVDTTDEFIGYAGNTAAAAARNYLKTVGSDPVSLAAAQNGVDKAVATVVTPPPATAQTFALTAGADFVTGGKADDTIGSSTAGFFNSGDDIDGGDGNDTLTVTSETADITGSGITIANVETASLSTSGAINLDTTGWTGLATLAASGTGAYVLKTAAGTGTTASVSAVGGQQVLVDGGANVTVNATGITTGSITVGSNVEPSGAIVVNATETGAAAMGAISVVGGTSVTVNEVAGNAVNTMSTNPAIIVTGTAATTAVAMNAAVTDFATPSTVGVTRNTMTVTDVNAGSTTLAGTITSVTAGNFTQLTINDNALANLTLNRGTGNVTINNGGLTASAPHALTLNLNVDVFNIADANVYTTLNVVTTGNYQLGFRDTALTTLNVSGTGAVQSFPGVIDTALQTVTVTGAAGLAGSFATNTALASIDTSGTTGSSSVLIDPSKTSFVGGAGLDVVSLSSATLASAINLGDGTDVLVLAAGTTSLAFAVNGGNGLDTLMMNAADAAAASVSSAFASKVGSFEALTLMNAGNQVIDVAMLGGYNFVQTAGMTGLTLNNVASGFTLSLSGNGTSATVNGTDFSGTHDVIGLSLVSSAAISAATAGITANGAESIQVNTTNQGGSGTFNDALTLVGDTLKVITVIGNAGLALTAAGTTIGGVDASFISAGDFSWTSGALAGTALVKGSAQGNDVINLAAETHTVTFTGGTGNVSITTGSGDDTISVGRGANTVVTGNGTDRVNITAVNAASSTVYTTITGLAHGGGDIVSVGGSVSTMGHSTDSASSLLDGLNAAAAGSASSAAPMLQWFTFDSNTYIVKDVSAGSSFVDGADMVVKLVGALDLSAATAAGGVITL